MVEGDDRYNYPPGSDHLPRGDDEKYRDGWDRIFQEEEQDTPNETTQEDS